MQNMGKHVEVGQWIRFEIHMGLVCGKVFVGSGILSTIYYGLRYEMVLECGFGIIFGV